MKKFISNFLRFCPKTGRFIGFKMPGGFYKLFLPIAGLLAMIWVLIRVIPKPSRLSYPCVRTAMPVATGFIGYLSMLALSAIAFIRSKKHIRLYPVFFLGAFLIFGISGFYFSEGNIFQTQIALDKDATVKPNEPMGIAQGIYPGRVVWVHNPNAVNQNCNPVTYGHSWYMPENNNQPVIDQLVSVVIDSLTGKKTDTEAWEMIFKYHNEKRGKGAVNYQPGEKIFLKINICSSWTGNFDAFNLTKVNNAWYGMSETSPAIVTAVLRQLVNVVHVAQTDIYVGDPMKHIYKHEYDQWHSEFPNVHYIDPGNYGNLGREKVLPSSTAIIHYSDKGAILRENVSYPGTPAGGPVTEDALYTIFQNAEYIINIPQLKGHKRAGITMFAKNHFGSVTRENAMHMHNGLPAPMEMQNDTSRTGYGLYRIQVDLMTYSLLREKNLFFLMDGLWASDYEQDKPLKFEMAPFNNTYSSSVFASFDNVAIESVGYDFLRSEFTIARGAGTFAQIRGADDYLHQAADSANWPDNIKYNPDNDGVYIKSLGVHEHWNNKIDKKYTRNLGTGDGIELMDIELNNATAINDDDYKVNDRFGISNYPNPFYTYTTISYSLPERSSVEISIYDAQGRIINIIKTGIQKEGDQSTGWNAMNAKGSAVSSGIYIFRVKAVSADGRVVLDKSAKMMLQK